MRKKQSTSGPKGDPFVLARMQEALRTKQKQNREKRPARPQIAQKIQDGRRGSIETGGNY